MYGRSIAQYQMKEGGVQDIARQVFIYLVISLYRIKFKLKAQSVFNTFTVIIHIIEGQHSAFNSGGSGGSFGVDDDANENGGLVPGNVENGAFFGGDDHNNRGQGGSFGGNNGGQGDFGKFFRGKGGSFEVGEGEEGSVLGGEDEYDGTFVGNTRNAIHQIGLTNITFSYIIYILYLSVFSIQRRQSDHSKYQLARINGCLCFLYLLPRADCLYCY